MLKDVAMLSWVGLVKQVLPSRDSCWLAIVPMVQGIEYEPARKERMAIQTIVLPRVLQQQQLQQH